MLFVYQCSCQNDIQLAVTSVHSHITNYCTAKYAKLHVISAGLQSEHLPAAEVE